MRRVFEAPLTAAALLTLGACASTGSITPPHAAAGVPASLQPPPGEVLFLQAQGVGVQIYDCSPRAGQLSSYEWTFRAPEATLKDKSGHVIGRHFMGPTWELDEGGSVIGDVKAHAPSPDAAAVPWLLLTARATAGSGIMTQTTSVQRLQTVGGLAPATGCEAKNAGKVARVPYTANYYFYRHAP